MSALTSQSVLIHESGNRLVVKYSEFVANEVVDQLLELIGTNDKWSPSDHADTEAFYFDQPMTIIDMRRIIGFGC
jgi:hypothetical protein